MGGQLVFPDRDRWRRTLLAMALLLTAAGPASAGSLQVPPITDPASPEHHVGKVVFVELVTPDLAASKQFYGSLFGWTFGDIHSGDIDYAEAFLDGRSVAGLVHKAVPPGEHRQPAWLSFLSVRDVDATNKLALAEGARELSAPHNLPNRGREAVLADPQGAVFAILASSSGDPADELASPGEWIWSSLITKDPDQGAAFYQKLFDYEVYDLTSDNSAQQLIMATENYSRASANVLPAGKPNIHPHWLNFVRVDNAVATTAKAASLGARVLVVPQLDRHGAMIAVVADPQGAPFGLLEWPDSETKEITR